MIAKILPKPSKNFAGVIYNTNKVDRNKGELMLAVNFGALDAMTNLRPQDYINYFQSISAVNKRIENLQFHAVLSAKGKSYNKHELTQIAVSWIKEMEYGEQPYLIVFHKDTDNNHVHVVSARVGRDGKKISSAYEKIRAVRNINKVLGYTAALQYNFSTRAQFYLLLENQGFIGRDYDEEKLQERIDAYIPDKERMSALKQLFNTLKSQSDFVAELKYRYQIELVFHSSEGKKPYGYTVIDHDTKQVFKGSEILNLKYLLDDVDHSQAAATTSYAGGETGYSYEIGEANKPQPIYIRPISIADDVDDQQVLGMKRRRQKKARTNTR